MDGRKSGAGAGTGLVFATLAAWVIGAHASPDYYARTEATIRAWTFSGGLPWMVLQVIVASLAIVWALRRHTAGGWMIAAFSFILAAMWLIQPFLVCITGDGLFFRFP